MIVWITRDFPYAIFLTNIDIRLRKELVVVLLIVELVSTIDPDDSSVPKPSLVKEPYDADQIGETTFPSE